MALVLSVYVVLSLRDGKTFGGYFFGRPVWFSRETRPVRYGMAVFFCAAVAVVLWVRVLWELLGKLIGT
jgi:hypothetical protein